MKSYFKIMLLLLIPLLLMGAYSLWGGEWWLEKADFSKVGALMERMNAELNPEPMVAEIVEEDAVVLLEIVEDDTVEIAVPNPVDTTAQRILFFGDSMLEGLSRRMCDYAMENGHELTSVIWYSSTSQTWAESDTLEHFMMKFNPTFVVVCLCSNELFVRDLKDREGYIRRVVEKVGDLPFVWISPPNWKEDTGVNDLIIKYAGRDRYFDSRGLELKRGKDRVHPTFDAAAEWMDSVAVWMGGDSTRHPIRMSVPREKRKRSFRQILLLPPE